MNSNNLDIKVSIPSINLSIEKKLPSSDLSINIPSKPTISLDFDKFLLEDIPIWEEEYEKYEINPSADQDLILFTDNKKLLNNIIIHKIPYNEVSNEAGGTTISINS